MANPKKIVPVVESVKAEMDNVVRQRILVGYEISDQWGAVRKIGAVQLMTAAHLAADPRILLHEVMKASGNDTNPDFTLRPRKSWLEIISISPIKREIVTSSADPRYLEFVQNQGK